MHQHTAISSLFAIGCALSWALCTFAGGRVAGKFSSKMLVLFYNVVAATYFLIISDFDLSNLTSKFIFLSIGAGVSHAFGLSLVSYALAKGRSGVIAPTSTVFEICVPVLAATVFAKALGFYSYIGILILISSIFLLRKADNESHETSVLKDLIYGLGAGTGFGLSITFLSFIANEAKNNSLVIMQLASIVFLTSLLVIGKIKDKNQEIGFKNLKSSFILINIFVFLFFEMTGLIFLNAALKNGNGGIVAALASIPFTLGIILISVIFLKEKLSKVQYIGVGIAVIGIAITHLSTI